MDHKFKCCNKSFIHYVCINCKEVIHKYCASKFKKQIRFLADNKIICCGSPDDSHTSSEGDSTENLERTIQELVEEREMKDKHFQKLKRNSELLIREATVREDELNEIIKNQEENIQKLRELITELKRSLGNYTKKVTQTAGTQTFVDTKTVSIGTDSSQSVKTNNSSTSTDINCVHADKQTATNETFIEASMQSKTCDRRKLLVLSDDYGRNVGKFLYRERRFHNFQIQSIYKPGASYQQVIENLEDLSRNFTNRDHVVIIAGSNNFTRATKYPLFKDIWNKVEKCRDLNFTLVNVPYKKKSVANHYIRKFNQKLSDFVVKINRYIPGRVDIVDVGDKTGGITKHQLCKEILRVTRSPRKSLSNLVFIESKTNIVEKVSQHSVSDKAEDTDSISEVVPAEVENNNKAAASVSNFLYPRLSQLDIAN